MKDRFSQAVALLRGFTHDEEEVDRRRAKDAFRLRQALEPAEPRTPAEYYERAQMLSDRSNALPRYGFTMTAMALREEAFAMLQEGARLHQLADDVLRPETRRPPRPNRKARRAREARERRPS